MKKSILSLAFLVFAMVGLKAQTDSTRTTTTTTTTVITTTTTNGQPVPAQAAPAQTTTPQKTEQTKTKPCKFREKPARRFQFGLSAYVNSSFFSSQPTGYTVSTRIGFNTGVHFRAFIYKRLFVATELNYYYTNYLFRRNLDRHEDKVRTHALQVPLLVGFALVHTKLIRLITQTGPAIGFNLDVPDNDFRITENDFTKPYSEWVIDLQLHISKFTITSGFVAGMTKYLGESKNYNHRWYAGIGFSF